MRSRVVRILSVGEVELKGILRSHPFRIFAPAAALLVVAAPFLVVFAFRERPAMVAQVGISTASLFATLLALFAGAGSVVRERESGLRDLLLSRPLRPGDWIVGKWIGIGAAVLLAVAGLGGVHLLSLALRGGPPRGYAPLAAALGAAFVQGLLAAAVALLFSLILRAAPAFVAALLFSLLGHAAALLPDAPAATALRHLLPRWPELSLAGEAAFGPFPSLVFALAAAHGVLYALFVLALAARLAARRG